MDDQTFDPIARKIRALAAEARAWAKEHGVAGGDAAEAAMLLLTAGALIGVEEGHTRIPSLVAEAAHASAHDVLGWEKKQSGAVH